ncbi:hypothetical protein SO802_026114 [Lithocarpus litseifolius]|uniref:Uncharacterized protein n=1 Tax=Lithocarpus litseifolius TaxID=425828 RepID=A0AAW2C291_9ROSI
MDIQLSISINEQLRKYEFMGGDEDRVTELEVNRATKRQRFDAVIAAVDTAGAGFGI